MGIWVTAHHVKLKLILILTNKTNPNTSLTTRQRPHTHARSITHPMRDDPRSHQPYNIACPAPRHTNPYIFLTESHTRAKAHLLVSYATQKKVIGFGYWLYHLMISAFPFRMFRVWSLFYLLSPQTKEKRKNNSVRFTHVVRKDTATSGRSGSDGHLFYHTSLLFYD